MTGCEVDFQLKDENVTVIRAGTDLVAGKRFARLYSGQGEARRFDQLRVGDVFAVHEANGVPVQPRVLYQLAAPVPLGETDEKRLMVLAPRT